MITRKGLADEIDQIDEAIKAYNESKREAFDAYRDQLIAAGVAKPNVKTEIEAVKAAIRRRRAVRKDEAAEIEKGELIDEIFDEITTVSRAPRAHVENIGKFDREARAKLRTSEAMDDNKAFSAELVAAGLISEKAHAENVALSDAVAKKYGAGVVDAETGEILDDAPRSDGGLNIVTKHTEIASASQGEPKSPSAEAEASGANAGGGYVESSAQRASVATSSGPDVKWAQNSPEEATKQRVNVHSQHEGANAQAIVRNECVTVVGTESGTVSHFTKPKYVLRPNCRNPEACGGYGANHCHPCQKAMREKAEEVA